MLKNIAQLLFPRTQVLVVKWLDDKKYLFTTVVITEILWSAVNDRINGCVSQLPIRQDDCRSQY